MPSNFVSIKSSSEVTWMEKNQRREFLEKKIIINGSFSPRSNLSRSTLFFLPFHHTIEFRITLSYISRCNLIIQSNNSCFSHSTRYHFQSLDHGSTDRVYNTISIIKWSSRPDSYSHLLIQVKDSRVDIHARLLNSEYKKRSSKNTRGQWIWNFQKTRFSPLSY